MKQLIPQADDRTRSVCTDCGFIDYENPKLVVGTIPEFKGGDHHGSILLCKRNIEPRKDKWTLPAGYLENSETLQQGAVRETLEETRAKVTLIEPYRMYNIVHVNQIYLMFRACLESLDFGPTTESSEVCLFKENQIPWDDIAFLVIKETLKDYLKDKKQQRFEFLIKDLII